MPFHDENCFMRRALNRASSLSLHGQLHRDQSGDASRQRLVVHQTSSKRVVRHTIHLVCYIFLFYMVHSAEWVIPYMTPCMQYTLMQMHIPNSCGHFVDDCAQDVPVEIFCPLSSGTSRMQALPPEDSKVKIVEVTVARRGAEHTCHVTTV